MRSFAHVLLGRRVIALAMYPIGLAIGLHFANRLIGDPRAIAIGVAGCVLVIAIQLVQIRRGVEPHKIWKKHPAFVLELGAAVTTALSLALLVAPWDKRYDNQ